MRAHRGHILHLALSPVDPSRKTINILRVFPEGFSAWCLILFTPPVLKGFYLAGDPLVSSWMGSGPQAVFALPLLFIVIAYIIHKVKATPRKRAIILSLVGSSLALGVQANRIGVTALKLGSTFTASDCQQYMGKYELESAWQKAQKFRAACSFGEEHLIQRCPGYEQEAVNNPVWTLLWKMEHEYMCAGWCEPEVPLWTFGHVKDSCSTVVAQLLSETSRDSTQIVIHSMIVLALSTVTLIALGPSLRERGIDW